MVLPKKISLFLQASEHRARGRLYQVDLMPPHGCDGSVGDRSALTSQTLLREQSFLQLDARYCWTKTSEAGLATAGNGDDAQHDRSLAV